MARKKDVFRFKYQTNTDKGYYGIQCELEDESSMVWKCVFPTKMKLEEIAEAITQIFQDKNHEIKEIVFVFFFKPIHVEKTQTKEQIIKTIEKLMS